MSTDPSERDPAGEPEIRYRVPINQWDEADRPREKLIQRGPAALSDAELIALLFGTGTRTKEGPVSAVELAQALLRTYGSLHKLSPARPQGAHARDRDRAGEGGAGDGRLRGRTSGRVAALGRGARAGLLAGRRRRRLRPAPARFEKGGVQGRLPQHRQRHHRRLHRERRRLGRVDRRSPAPFSARPSSRTPPPSSASTTTPRATRSRAGRTSASRGSSSKRGGSWACPSTTTSSSRAMATRAWPSAG